MILLSFVLLSLFSSENFRGLLERTEEERTSECFDQDNNSFKQADVLSYISNYEQKPFGVIKGKAPAENGSTGIQK